LRGVPSLDDLARLDLPVMVIRGAESNVLLPKAAADFAGALPDGRLVTVPECGHNVHSQNTLGFLREIDPFLEAVHGRG
jgi:pimeloyl-ACP methyl ester carboxylesterase